MSEPAERSYTALIAGATGAVGAALARELAQNAQWRVLGISRNQPNTAIDCVEYIRAYMGDALNLHNSLSQYPDITHLYYCGRATHAEQITEDAEQNLSLIRNVLYSVYQVAHDFQHAHVVQGGKYYGVHVGPFKIPAQEDDLRVPIDNFNYDQQDFLAHESSTAKWTWTASQPSTLLHYSPDIARNLVSSLGAYASLCKSLGSALDFPGPAGAYTSLTQVTTLTLLARAIAWMSTTPACANHAFNITNTDLFRWNELWPRLADAFDMPLGIIRPLKLAEVMQARDHTWQRICEQHEFPARPLNAIANWGYVDATVERYWDEIFSHNKCRQFGFTDWDDSIARFFTLLENYRDAKIIPN